MNKSALWFLLILIFGSVIFSCKLNQQQRNIVVHSEKGTKKNHLKLTIC